MFTDKVTPNLKKIEQFTYDPHQPLSKGSFGTVYKGQMDVAIKVINNAKYLENPDIYELFLREIAILRQIKGPHIVELIDVRRTPNNLYLFMEYCDSGDLETYIKGGRKFSEFEALFIIKQISKAFVTIDELKILNEQGKEVTIMHRDIKPANILFHKGLVKISDFGFAKLVEKVDQDARKKGTILGTPLYMAPQLLEETEYSAKCDVWSTGVILYQLLFGQLPWTSDTIAGLFEQIKNGVVILGEIKKETQELLLGMLEFTDEKRLSWKDVYTHLALKDIQLFY